MELDFYQLALRPLLFSWLKADPEFLHDQVMERLHWLETHRDRPTVQRLLTTCQHLCGFAHPALEQTLWSLTFPNPVGLAAGFDKNGVAADLWGVFGFGYAELGTVTRHAQPGNPKPRLFRLLSDQAALNRMGFNNQGAVAMAAHLKHRAAIAPVPALPKIPVGINLGKSKVTPLEAAAEDYCESFRQLKALGDYFVVNVSSPNTPGLRSLQSAEPLGQILAALQQENQGEKPLLVKIAPDLEWEAIATIVDLAQAHRLAGIIATNTTISREGLNTQILPTTGQPIQSEAGGISGAPLRRRSTEVIRQIYQHTQGTLPIIGVGGIFTADDAWEKITAGASLLQLYTGWIYEGPWMLKRIHQGLVQKLKAHQLNHISEAIGLGSRTN